MNADKMTARVADGTGASHVRQWMTQTSPKASGRIAGACYLAIFVAGEIFSVLVPNLGLLNTIDAATLDHIVSHQSAFWVGYPFFLLVVAFRLILMLLFYELFKPVNKRIALPRERGHGAVQPHLLHRPGVLRVLRPAHRLSRLQVHLHSSSHWRPHGHHGPGVAHVLHSADCSISLTV